MMVSPLQCRQSMKLMQSVLSHCYHCVKHSVVIEVNEIKLLSAVVQFYSCAVV